MTTWRIGQVIMSSVEGLDARLSHLAGCRKLRLLEVPLALSAAASTCVHKLRYHADLFFKVARLLRDCYTTATRLPDC